ncbi:MAG: hypothetical protein FD119_2582 [Stygiobacter sp.]|nr:MAG: hypothetical protein FD119_2582 [Stygiobacter sp.]
MTRYRVPKAMEPIFNAVTTITDEFCRAHLDDHYGELARKAAAILARKSPSPLVKGNAKSWAGGILYALAKVNHLGGDGGVFSSLGEMCDLIGIGRSTGLAKGGEVVAALKIRPLDTKWLHPDVLADDPRAWFLDVGGMIVDARQLPPDMQQQAYRLGLIPFVPSDADSRKVAGERDAVLAEYQRWRRHNTDIQTALAADVMIDGTAIKLAVRLGIAKTPAAALGVALEKLAPALDLAIYGGKLPEQLLTARPAPKGQRATMLKAMATATFSLFEVIDLHLVAGVRLRDLRDDAEMWLMDAGLELSAPKGITLAMRVIKPADFAMTTGVSIRMTDAVWAAVEKTIGGTRADIVRHGDRDQLVEAIYRAGVKAKTVL